MSQVLGDDHSLAFGVRKSFSCIKSHYSDVKNSINLISGNILGFLILKQNFLFQIIDFLYKIIRKAVTFYLSGNNFFSYPIRNKVT